eukprot:2806650-Prymnesium_polylepis.1
MSPSRRRRGRDEISAGSAARARATVATGGARRRRLVQPVCVRAGLVDTHALQGWCAAAAAAD